MPIEIKAAVLHAVDTPICIETLILDDPDPDEVLIEIRAAGLCHSDLHYIDGAIGGNFPMVLGHEAAGVVIQVGDKVTGLKPGDHVIPLFSPECRQCANCVSGRTNFCLKPATVPGRSRMKTLDGKPVYRASLGTTATHAVLSEHAVCKIRDDAPFDKVFYCGCGITTGVGAAMFQAKVKRDDKVIVFGVGGIGLNVLQGARLAGARQIVAVDANPLREESALKFGATHFVNVHDHGDKIVEHLQQITGGGADYCFECIGNVEVMRQALAATNPYWGRAIVVGIAPAGKKVSFDAISLILGRGISGSVFGGAKGKTDLPKVVDWYMNGDIMVDELVTHTMKLEDINHGYDLMRRGESIRTAIVL